MKMGSGPRNADEAPLRERSKSSRGHKTLQNIRLILVEENYSNRSRHSHAAVITCLVKLAPERGGLARCPSRFAAVLASTHCPLWLGCVTACRSIRPTKLNDPLLYRIENIEYDVFPILVPASSDRGVT